ncbi:Hypothetical predicted protein [Lecanosticta acicola]|uniref:LysM domain-containing protein n=1 Tax=Lecanosticta acicola TaxID=111012 RepID=A0AAI8YT70_9PEZI|nr:Hypothetical predicted protein [Lecanosticta acicola]
MASRGRYELLDSDEQRLPEGMQRVGYDADTQTYTYRDSDGSYWEGEEGNRYGTLHRAGTRSSPNQPPIGQPISQRTIAEDWRYLAPFMVIVIVVLLSLFRFLDSASTPALPTCSSPDMEAYRITKGDTCWDLAQVRGTTVDGLKVANPGLNCDRLLPGYGICVPVEKEVSIPEDGNNGGNGPPRFQCYQITCNKAAGGDEACANEGCGGGCSEGGKCMS